MPSFYLHAGFLFHYVAIPVGILVVCYACYAIARNRFERSLDAICDRHGINLFLAVPDIFRIFLVLVVFPLWLQVFHSHYTEVVPAETTHLPAVFRKVVEQTLYTSPVDKLFVPSQGNRYSEAADEEIPLSMTYWMLGLRRYRVELADKSVVHAFVGLGLSAEQAREQIESEPLLLTPVSQYYFTPQSLSLAQRRAKDLKPDAMVQETLQHLAPIESFRAATRRVAMLFLPLLLFAGFLRWLQIDGLRQALDGQRITGKPAVLLAPRSRSATRLTATFLGVSAGTVRTEDGRRHYFTALPPRLSAMSPVEGWLVPLLPLPAPSRPWQIGLLGVGCLRPALHLLFPYVFVSGFQQVFIPAVLIDRLKVNRADFIPDRAISG